MYQLQMSQAVGAIRDNFDVRIDTQPEFTTIGSTTATFKFKYTIDKISGAAPAKVYYKGMQLQVPPQATPQEVTLTIPVSSGSYNMAWAYFVLIATKKTVQFSTAGPVMHVSSPKTFSGVTGPDFPYELPAADNEIYGNERVVVTVDPTTVTLGTDEEMICIFATLRPRFWWANGSSVETGTSNTVTNVILHNAANLQELAAMTKFIIPGFDLPHLPAYTKGYLNNGGLVDAMLHLNEQYIQGQSWQDNRLSADRSAFNAYVTSNNSAIATINATLGSIGVAVSGISANLSTLSDTLDTLSGIVVTKADKIQENWHYLGDPDEPTFNSGWYNPLTGLGRARFMRDNMGFVHFQGRMKKDSADFAEVAWTLPNGYRPDNDLVLPVTFWPGGGFPSIGFIQVSDNGQILVMDNLSNDEAHYSLESLTPFRAAL